MQTCMKGIGNSFLFSGIELLNRKVFTSPFLYLPFDKTLKIYKLFEIEIVSRTRKESNKIKIKGFVFKSAKTSLKGTKYLLPGFSPFYTLLSKIFAFKDS